MAHAAAVDKAFAAASAEQIAQVSLATFTRKLPPKPACVETVSPIAGNILPMLHTALQEYHEALAVDGGSLSGYLVRGPMLHCGQLLDNSCAFRSIQMVLSSMMRQSEHRWPGVRSVMLDVPEARISQSNSVPSVRRLQRTLHKAWEAGFDTVGAEHTDNSTWIRGIVLNMPPNTPNALPFIGAPVVQPGLKYIGASDIWALMRWTGFRTELHDFIDGQTEDEPTAYHLLFEWCWSHFARHAREQPSHAAPRHRRSCTSRIRRRSSCSGRGMRLHRRRRSAFRRQESPPRATSSSSILSPAPKTSMGRSRESKASRRPTCRPSRRRRRRTPAARIGGP